MKLNQLVVAFLLSTLIVAPFMIQSEIEPQTSHYDKEVLVEMYQFNFNFTIDGVIYTDFVTLYTGIDYLFNVTSVDVQHGMNLNGNSFNSMPGEYQTAVITFTTNDTISYKCTVGTCGTGHGTMNGDITVLEPSGSTDTSGKNITITTTETLVETTTQTEERVSNQTITEKFVTTTTLIEQVSFPIVGLFFALIVTTMIRLKIKPKKF